MFKLIRYILCVLPWFVFATEIPSNNYYLQLNIGESQSQRVGGDFPLTNARNSGIYGAAIGYKFNDHFRADLSVDYRKNYRLNNTHISYDEDGEEGETHYSSYKHEYDMKISSLSTMVNLYYDILTFRNFTPYIVGGMGASYNRVYNTSMITTNEYGDSIACSYSNGYKTNLATKIGLGARYHINKNFDAAIQYHYVNLGSFKTGNLSVDHDDNSYINTQPLTGKLHARELIFSVSYNF